MEETELKLTDFTVGDRVAYILSHGNYPSTVVNITSKRLVIRLDAEPYHRSTTPKGVRKLDG